MRSGAERKTRNLQRSCNKRGRARKLKIRNTLDDGWNRGPELNRRPDDYSIHSLVLVLQAFSLTSPHGLAGYSAPIVRKMFATFVEVCV
jgi:hypothetical protein